MTLPEDLVEAVGAAAREQGADATEASLRRYPGRRVIAEWQSQHGHFDGAELAAARAEMAAADAEVSALHDGAEFASTSAEMIGADVEVSDLYGRVTLRGPRGDGCG